MRVIIMPICPKCGCSDIRTYDWIVKCYKCGYVFEEAGKIASIEEDKKKLPDWKAIIKKALDI